MSRVVLLNGVSSVGKGSLAKALQRIAARPCCTCRWTHSWR